MLVRQLTSDAAAPVLVGAGDKGMSTVEFGEPGAQVAEGLDGANNFVLDPGAVTSLTKSQLGSEQFLFGETGAGMTSNVLLPSGGVVSDGMDGLRGAAKKRWARIRPFMCQRHLPVKVRHPWPTCLSRTQWKSCPFPQRLKGPAGPGGRVTRAASNSNPTQPRSRWPWVLASLVAVALVAGAIYSLLGKNDKAPPSAPAPVAPVATPAAPEQLPEVVEAPWSRLLQQCLQSRPSQNLRSRSQSRSPLPM